MAKPNYSFEKRQRELAKKRKKEEKAAEKAARKTGPGSAAPGDEGDVEGAADEQGAGPSLQETEPKSEGPDAAEPSSDDDRPDDAASAKPAD